GHEIVAGLLTQRVDRLPSETPVGFLRSVVVELRTDRVLQLRLRPVLCERRVRYRRNTFPIQGTAERRLGELLHLTCHLVQPLLRGGRVKLLLRLPGPGRRCRGLPPVRLLQRPEKFVLTPALLRGFGEDRPDLFVF